MHRPAATDTDGIAASLRCAQWPRVATSCSSRDSDSPASDDCLRQAHLRRVCVGAAAALAIASDTTRGDEHLPVSAVHTSSASPVGIVVALPAEARTLGPAARRNTIADLGGQARVYVCGVGPDNAQRAGQALLAEPVSGLVSWGTAGGLAPGVAAGACVIPDSVIGADAAYETDPQWRARIAACEPVRSGGGLYSTGELVASPLRKAALHDETGAVIVDAESGAVAELARDAGLPFVCIRVVLDSATMTLPAFATEGLDEHGFPATLRMLAALARNPADLASLPALVRCHDRARRKLAAIRRAAGPRLLGP